MSPRDWSKHSQEILYFRWQYVQNGYEWEQVRPFYNAQGEHDSQHLERVENMLTTKTRPIYKAYDPLESTGLFIEFSNIDINQSFPSVEKDIQLFANKYGLLTQGQVILPGPNPIVGESLSFWRKEIVKMQQAVERWSYLQKGNISGLRKIYRITGPRRFSDEEFILTERQAVQRIIDKNMKGKVDPRILRYKNELNLYFIPENLLGAMWLQFARAVTGGGIWKKCRNCPKMFIASRIRSPLREYRKWFSSRSDKDTCSDNCRKSLSKKRKKAIFVLKDRA
jgi:hypothetical protein